MVELVYTRHLKCLGASHAGSTPVSPTIFCCQSTSTQILDAKAVAEGRNGLILLLMLSSQNCILLRHFDLKSVAGSFRHAGSIPAPGTNLR